MLTILVLLATLLADLAVGVAAYKMAKAANQATATNTQTSARILELISKQDLRLDNHEVRIEDLEKAA